MSFCRRSTYVLRHVYNRYSAQKFANLKIRARKLARADGFGRETFALPSAAVRVRSCACDKLGVSKLDAGNGYWPMYNFRIAVGGGKTNKINNDFAASGIGGVVWRRGG